MGRSPELNLYVYRCNFCSGWHLTKNNHNARSMHVRAWLEKEFSQ